MKHADFQPTIPLRPKLSEADLDMRELERAKWQRERDALQLRLRQPRPLPAGCDQQGRYDARPQGPAEASTALGADDERDQSTPGWRLLGLAILLTSAGCVLAGLAALFLLC